MRRSRPCRICRRWFLPHPRSGTRQCVCPSRDCQRERHRRACRAWHARNPGYDREDRLRRRLWREMSEGAPARLDWSAARDAVGLEVVVVMEEAAKEQGARVRDAVLRQLLVSSSVGARVGVSGMRDGIAVPLRPG